MEIENNEVMEQEPKKKKKERVKVLRRVLLKVAYDGTNYVGWQMQPNGLAIEEVINSKLKELTGEDILVIGASRTDSGVHALGNVAVFDTYSPIPPEKFSYCLNKVLPDDIVIKESFEVASDFHPRHVDCEKCYEYVIYNSRFPNPLKISHDYFLYFNLNVDKMREAAKLLEGEHDFLSFSNPKGQQKTSVRNVYSICITEIPDDFVEGSKEIRIRVRGNGFLYNMIRIIVGTLIKVGLNVYKPEHIKEILEAKDRGAAGPTAPACGLKLVEIKYDVDPRLDAKA